MERISSFLPRAFLLVVALELLALAAVAPNLSGLWTTHAQTSTCAAGAQPPTDTSHAIIRSGEIVYCIIDNSITDQNEINQISRGLDSWNAQNSSSIQFVLGAPPANGPFSTGVENTVFVFQNGNLGNTPYAQTEFTSTHADGSLASATITFNTGGARASQTGTAPFYDPNLPVPPGMSSNGYDTIFQKETEHEIGHPMGLNDADGPDGGSVMNRAAWGCPNDTCGRKPLGVTNCDGSTAQQVSNRPLPYTGYTGGGGGGGGGGSYDGGGGYYDYCTPYYWVYYESWDDGKTWDIVDVSYAGCW
ncbi:MAG: hypothetical protein QOH49_3032 [Acidobacteriota bacterium]|jgi:hypothetical protein|nr:hypothetical protein [Acidobacteriota bacterium]